MTRYACEFCGREIDSDIMMCPGCKDHCGGIEIRECADCGRDAFEDTWDKLNDTDVICEDCKDKYLKTEEEICSETLKKQSESLKTLQKENEPKKV